MATSKKNIFVEAELEWSEQQLISWKAYVDQNPLHELKDRIEWKPTAKGGTMPMVIASIEQQGKFIQETMKNYLALLKEVDIMREKEQEKAVKRGKGELNGQQNALLKQANADR